MSEPKFENRPFERLKLGNFGTLREIFPKNLAQLSLNLARFSPNLARFSPSFGQNFENCDPLRRKFSIFVILGPFQRQAHEFPTL